MRWWVAEELPRRRATKYGFMRDQFARWTICQRACECIAMMTAPIRASLAAAIYSNYLTSKRIGVTAAE